MGRSVGGRAVHVLGRFDRRLRTEVGEAVGAERQIEFSGRLPVEVEPERVLPRQRALSTVTARHAGTPGAAPDRAGGSRGAFRPSGRPPVAGSDGRPGSERANRVPHPFTCPFLNPIHRNNGSDDYYIISRNLCRPCTTPVTAVRGACPKRDRCLCSRCTRSGSRRNRRAIRQNSSTGLTRARSRNPS